jgi:hypothetical protein
LSPQRTPYSGILGVVPSVSVAGARRLRARAVEHSRITDLQSALVHRMLSGPSLHRHMSTGAFSPPLLITDAGPARPLHAWPTCMRHLAVVPSTAWTPLQSLSRQQGPAHPAASPSAVQLEALRHRLTIMLIINAMLAGPRHQSPYRKPSVAPPGQQPGRHESSATDLWGLCTSMSNGIQVRPARPNNPHSGGQYTQHCPCHCAATAM